MSNSITIPVNLSVNLNSKMNWYKYISVCKSFLMSQSENKNMNMCLSMSMSMSVEYV